MSVILFRVAQRQRAIRALQSAHVRAKPAPRPSGFLIALVILGVFLFGFMVDMHRLIAWIIS